MTIEIKKCKDVFDDISARTMYRKINNQEFFAFKLDSWFVFVEEYENQNKQQKNKQLELF